MSRTATATAFGYFAAAYPTARKADETTRDVWAEELARYPSTTILAAAKRWVRSEVRFPTLAAFLECCQAVAPTPTPTLERGSCPSCDGLGWEFIGLRGPGTVTRCQHGCLPPTPERWGAEGPDDQERERGRGGIASARGLLARVRFPNVVPIRGPFARKESQ